MNDRFQSRGFFPLFLFTSPTIFQVLFLRPPFEEEGFAAPFGQYGRKFFPERDQVSHFGRFFVTFLTVARAD